MKARIFTDKLTDEMRRILRDESPSKKLRGIGWTRKDKDQTKAARKMQALSRKRNRLSLVALRKRRKKKTGSNRKRNRQFKKQYA